MLEAILRNINYIPVVCGVKCFHYKLCFPCIISTTHDKYAPIMCPNAGKMPSKTHRIHHDPLWRRLYVPRLAETINTFYNDIKADERKSITETLRH